MLVVHPHFHPRRTGVTAHVEAIVPALNPHVETRVVGNTVRGDLPRISLFDVLRRARREPVLWHAHRNNELLLGFCLKLFAPSLRLAFTRHAAKPAGAFTRFIARFAPLRIALTEEVRDNLGLPAHVVGHGVDVARFQRSPQARDEQRAQLGWPAGPTIGMVGRIRPEKGQGDFIEAVAPLLDFNPDWRVVLVGRAAGASDEAFRADLQRLTHDRVHFAGELPDALPAYRAFDVVVQASRSEGFSLVLLEAMAAGCCVVAARLPHFDAIVQDGKDGFLYPPGDIERLREIVSTLFAQPSLIESVSRAASAKARGAFDIAREAGALFELYKTALGRS